MAKGKIINRGIYLYIDGKEVKNDINSIRKEMRALEREQNKLTIGSEEYNRAGRRIRELNGILGEHRAQLRDAATAAANHRKGLGRIADGFNRYIGLATSAVATITGLSFTVRKAVDAYAEMEEAEAQVVKYTGLTKEEVKELNEEFKRLNTRTTREQLNELAGDAGRLGITAKEDIMEFVDAANMINVGLGEDLGKDAVKDIGKLAQMFGEDKKKGLRGAMLATGSAINEVAQNSSAAESYLVDFTARVSGAANQAHISQADIIGFASVLDQNMMQVEMAGTAFSGLLMKMYQEPAKFAQMSGKDVASFTRLLKEDANEAVLTLLETLSQQGGLDRLAPIFKEMSLDGARASGVVSALAGNIEQIRIEQERANKAYEEGVSITKEYNVQNNTIQAQLEKNKKQFRDYIVSLGEKLLPLVSSTISAGSVTIKTIGTLTDFILRNKKAIVLLTSSIAIYYTTTKLATVWDQRHTAILKAKTAIVKALKTATTALNTAWRNNPVGLVVSALTALAGLYSLLKEKTEKLTQSQAERNGVMKLWASIQGDVNQKTEEERARIEQLNDMIHNNVLTNEQRRAAIEEMKSIVPGYVAQISEEGKVLNENTTAIENYISALEKKAKMEAVQEKLSALYKVKVNAELSRDRRIRGLNVSKQRLSEYKGTAKEYRPGQVDIESHTTRMNLQEAVNGYQKLVDEINTSIGVTDRQIKELTNYVSKNTPTVETKTEDDKKPLGNIPSGSAEGKNDKQKAAILKWEKEKNEIRRQYTEGAIKTQEEYEKKMRDLEMRSLEELMDNANLTDEKRTEFREKYYDTQLKLREDSMEAIRQIELIRKDEYQKEMEELRQNVEEREDLILQAIEMGNLSAEEEKKAGEALLSLKEWQAKEEQKILQKKLDQEAKLRREAEKKEIESLQEMQKYRFEQLDIDEDTSIGQLRRKEELLQEEYEAIQEAILMRADLSNEAKMEALESLDEQMNESRATILSKMGSIYTAYSQQLEQMGETFGAFLTGQEDAGRQLMKQTLLMMLDIVQQQIEIAILGATAQSILSGGLASGKLVQAIALRVAFAALKGAISSGFAQGGYTGAGMPDEPAGIVHRGEFVANRFALANPEVRRVLDVIDAAQRNGSIASLGAEDMAAVSSATAAAQLGKQTERTNAAVGESAILPALFSLLQQTNRTLVQVDRRFSRPIVAETYATGRGGVNQAQDLVKQMDKNAQMRRNKR